MQPPVRQEPRIVAFVERQMRAWAMGQEMAECVEGRRFDRPHHKLGDFITLSREAGAGGGQIAEYIGQRLGWEVLDKALVGQVAQRLRTSPTLVEVVDETGPDWARDILLPWLDRNVISHEKYVIFLCRVVMAAARRGNVVIVGRGANFLLPRDQGLAVRVVASEKYRIRNVMANRGLSESEARRYIAQVEQGRRQFVQRFFRRDIADPHEYDAVLSVDRLGPERAAEEIIAMFQRRKAWAV